jgi:predicted HicB family RNase H-like nuclease
MIAFNQPENIHKQEKNMIGENMNNKATNNKPQAVIVRMEPEIVRTLKITAAKQGRSMNDIVKSCVKKYLKKLLTLDEDVIN